MWLKRLYALAQGTLNTVRLEGKVLQEPKPDRVQRVLSEKSKPEPRFTV
jgi:hypothetical protein